MKRGIMKIKNRFAELVAAHERRTGRRWSYEAISEVTGIAASTLSAYANNKVRRFDAGTVEALLQFFGVGIDEFLIVEENGDDAPETDERSKAGAGTAS